MILINKNALSKDETQVSSAEWVYLTPWRGRLQKGRRRGGDRDGVDEEEEKSSAGFESVRTSLTSVLTSERERERRVKAE